MSTKNTGRTWRRKHLWELDFTYHDGHSRVTTSLFVETMVRNPAIALEKGTQAAEKELVRPQFEGLHYSGTVV